MAAPVQADIEVVWKATVSYAVHDVMRSMTFIFASRDLESAKLHLQNLISQKKLSFPKITSVSKYI